MFERFREWVTNHQRESFLIGLALVGAIALILASGIFQVEIGQFFAFQCVNDDECGTNQYCSSGGRCIGGTNPNTQTEPCVPVTPSSWTGGTNPCKKEQAGLTVPPIPDNWLPHVQLQNKGGLPGIATSAPYGSVNGYTCFGFTVPDGNPWAQVDALSGGTVPATKGTHTLTGQFWNNCPWEVEMTGGAAGSPTAGSGYIFKADGTIDEPYEGLDEIIMRGTTQLIPSCWNYPHIQGTTNSTNSSSGSSNSDPAPRTSFPDDEGVPTLYDWEATPIFKISRVSDYIGRFFGIRALAQQTGCTGSYSITLDLGSFNAGRVEANLGWKHHDMVGSAPGNTTIQDGYTIVANTGRNCTQTAGEFCAGQGSGGAGGGGTTGSAGPGPGGSFNCGTGSSSDTCWCGEWTDAIWAQRHAAAAHSCSPGYVLTAEYKAFLAENVGSFSSGDGAPDGTSDGDILAWSNGAVQNFINIMDENYTGGNQGCSPRSSGVDYAGIQQAYFAIGSGGIGLSGNGSAAVASTCRNNVAIDEAELTAICQSGSQVRLEWNIPVGAVANGIIKRVNGGEGQFLTGIGRLQTNYTDADLGSGNTYSYQHKAHASVASNVVEVRIDEESACQVLGSSATPTPTATPATPTPTAGPVCGDGTCSGGETPATCADDCGSPGAACGNNVCDSNESCSSCSSDCGSCSATCGDGVCSGSETASICADDCGSPGAACGNNVCDSNESCSSCSSDCGSCGTGGQVSTAGQTPTGPGAASFLAFMLASVVALLYVSYTHTSLFRRREVQKVRGDDSMDFRA